MSDYHANPVEPLGVRAERAPVPEASDPASRRLLLVEDNPTNQEVALGLLRRLGFRRVEVVPDGRRALDALERSDFDLVLMDCQLPELDGYQCARRIRRPDTRVRNQRIPVIAMTAHAMPGDREKCLASGMDDYLPKPVQTGAMKAALEKWLQVSLTAPGLAGMAAEPVPPEAVPAFDEADLLERVMGDRELARRILRTFLAEATRQLATLAEAVEREDAGRAVLAAHSLKGAAASVGGALVSATARRVEFLGRAGDLPAARELIPELAALCDDFRAASERLWNQEE